MIIAKINLIKGTTNMKKYPAEFKAQAASLVVDSGYSLKDAAKSSNTSESAIRSWVKQWRILIISAPH